MTELAPAPWSDAGLLDDLDDRYGDGAGKLALDGGPR